MNDDEMRKWFDANKQVLETAYLVGVQPWQQSGVGLRTPRTAMDWDVLRRPIADCITSSSTFLDIGCAIGQWGFEVEMVKSSHLETDKMAQTRVAVIRNSS
ncbi:MAG TPA: hypothetical protein DHW02_20970 [Ktedonobacter sp.]|nr:hypothetical protein [Ktedonobacter sp.]